MSTRKTGLPDTVFVDIGLEQGRRTEREAIVRWLRAEGERMTDPWTVEEAMNFVATAIERGEHLKPAEEGQN